MNVTPDKGERMIRMIQKHERFDIERKGLARASTGNGKYGLVVSFKFREDGWSGQRFTSTTGVGGLVNPWPVEVRQDHKIPNEPVWIESAELVWAEVGGRLGAMSDLYGVNFLTMLLPEELEELERQVVKVAKAASAPSSMGLSEG